MTQSITRLAVAAETDRRRYVNEGVTHYEIHITPEGEPLRRRPALDLDISKNRGFVRRYGHSKLHFPGSLLATVTDEQMAEQIATYWNAGRQRVALHGEAWIWEVDPE